MEDISFWSQNKQALAEIVVDILLAIMIENTRETMVRERIHGATRVQPRKQLLDPKPPGKWHPGHCASKKGEELPTPPQALLFLVPSLALAVYSLQKRLVTGVVWESLLPVAFLVAILGVEPNPGIPSGTCVRYPLICWMALAPDRAGNCAVEFLGKLLDKGDDIIGVFRLVRS